VFCSSTCAEFPHRRVRQSCYAVGCVPNGHCLSKDRVLDIDTNCQRFRPSTASAPASGLTLPSCIVNGQCRERLRTLNLAVLFDSLASIRINWCCWRARDSVALDVCPLVNLGVPTQGFPNQMLPIRSPATCPNSIPFRLSSETAVESVRLAKAFIY
jgi:hypothetical protein